MEPHKLDFKLGIGRARHVLGPAVGWTAAQYLAYFLSAWVVSSLMGAAAFGAFGQALAVATMGALAVTLRLEYAAQLQSRDSLSEPLFRLSVYLAASLGLAAVIFSLLVWRWVSAPVWLPAGALAVTALALLQIRASRLVRTGQVAQAAMTRALPALLMPPLQLAQSWAQVSHEAAVWVVPVAAWAALFVLGARVPVHFPKRAGGRPTGDPGWGRMRRLARARWPFVRAEWPSLMLNAMANHGQVLLVGWMAGDVAAGVMALALRLAMLPTSLLGPALTDALRARVIAGQTVAAARALLKKSLPRAAVLSLTVHLLAAPVMAWGCAMFFKDQGDALVTSIYWLLLLGALRLVTSPISFLLAWRSWFMLNLIGQCLLFACALLSVLWGIPKAGVPGAAMAYALSAALVYSLFLAASWRATRPQSWAATAPTPPIE